MDVRLDGKVAVVTGASAGIGAAIARAPVDSGAHVVIIGRDRIALDGVAASIGPQCAAVVADVSDPADMESLCRTVSDRLGGSTSSSLTPV